MERVVHVVHCVDTEGPLFESLGATFERLRQTFGLQLDPSLETLVKLQAGQIDLGGIEKQVQAMIAPQLLSYNDTWAKIEAMLSEALSPDYRNAVPDSDGNGWVYSWCCVDHVDYEINPRRRDLGYHKIWERYKRVLVDAGSQDEIGFHYHPHAFEKSAHLQATHWWANSDSLYQVLSRRVIDHLWFPSVCRPGFHVVRPDSLWFVEQFIPFLYANQSMTDTPDGDRHDATPGRYGDWRRAPQSWAPYHPSHDDYQAPGSCRCWIARCLNVGTRHTVLREADVRQAFEEAANGRPVVMAVADHDFRDIRVDVNTVRELLQVVSAEYPGVKTKYCRATDAMRDALMLDPLPRCNLDCRMDGTRGRGAVLTVTADSRIFGPQPYLAIRTKTGKYLHDNLDIDVPFLAWTYVFDGATVPVKDVDRIGIAANNSCGTTTVVGFDPLTDVTEVRYWNEICA